MKDRGIFLELWDAGNLLQSLAPTGRFEGLDSAKVIWKLRHGVPIESEKIGDYYGGAWPTHIPSDSEIESWTRMFEQNYTGKEKAT